MESILVVDDEKNYTAVLNAVLEEEGFETFVANSGAKALEVIEREEISLVITDMKMPVMDGLALHRGRRCGCGPWRGPGAWPARRRPRPCARMAIPGGRRPSARCGKAGRNCGRSSCGRRIARRGR